MKMTEEKDDLIQKYNKDIYNLFWAHIEVKNETSLYDYIKKNFNCSKFLEIGCGSYPKIDLKTGYFIDISEVSLKSLTEFSDRCIVADLTALPFKDLAFDCVFCFDVLEHIENDIMAIKQIVSLLEVGGLFVISVPLRPEFFNYYDEFFGHYRKYDIRDVFKLLRENNLKMIQYYTFSQIPLSPKFLDRISRFFLKYFNLIEKVNPKIIRAVESYFFNRYYNGVKEKIKNIKTEIDLDLLRKAGSITLISKKIK